MILRCPNKLPDRHCPSLPVNPWRARGDNSRECCWSSLPQSRAPLLLFAAFLFTLTLGWLLYWVQRDQTLSTVELLGRHEIPSNIDSSVASEASTLRSPGIWAEETMRSYSNVGLLISFKTLNSPSLRASLRRQSGRGCISIWIRRYSASSRSLALSNTGISQFSLSFVQSLTSVFLMFTALRCLYGSFRTWFQK